ncbi:hypothetical protein Glove_290g59 [Diversispora epigaea]|uniref:Uncharacterized protein n=1 Tax=Diversispora epigaea TaxID=1348612 RepID=A0A397I0U2_9GLOM|nr:hypothetical protein Glove_290g59 [Diversispora epigaea]
MDDCLESVDAIKQLKNSLDLKQPLNSEQSIAAILFENNEKFLLEKLENSVIFDLLIASNELELDELVEHLQSDFVNNNASWLKLNFVHVHWASALISSLKQDNLQLEEKKNPTLPVNLDKWTSENFLSLKETLKECLLHIRYFSFSNKDVIERFIHINNFLNIKFFQI